MNVRTTRTLKVTEQKITPEEIGELAALAQDPRYEALLNVMERSCIALETAHFNTATGNPEEVLGGHAVCKAAWLFFVYVQHQVQNAHHTRAGEDDEKNRPVPSLEDMLQGVSE